MRSMMRRHAALAEPLQGELSFVRQARRVVALRQGGQHVAGLGGAAHLQRFQGPPGAQPFAAQDVRRGGRERFS